MRGAISRKVVLLAGLVLLPSAAHAQDKSAVKTFFDGPPATVTTSADGSAIHVIGRIDENTFGLFLDASRQAPKARVVTLASGGGDMMAGYVMGSLIRLRGLDTHVDHICASACTLVFAAGKQRSLGPWGRIGFHQSYRLLPSGDTEPSGDYKVDYNFAKLVADDRHFALGGRSDSLTVHRLKPLGVGDEFLRKVLQTPPQSLWEPDNERLKAEHVVTRFFAEGEALPAPPAPGSQSREAFGAALQAKPFWKALAAAEPAFFAAGFVDQWRLVNSGMDGKQAELRARYAADDKVMERALSAPDDAMDRLAVHFGAVSQITVKYGYPYCRDDPARNEAYEAEILAQREASDAVFVALLQGSGKVAAPDEGKARGTMQKNYARLVALGGPSGPAPTDRMERCRGDEAMLRAVSQLEPKYRAPVMRALLVLSAADRARDAQKTAKSAD